MPSSPKKRRGEGEPGPEARPGERALHLEAAGEAAAEGGAGDGGGGERSEIDTFHLARAVVDAVVGDAAAEADGAAAEAHLAPNDLGHANLPAGLDPRLVVGDQIVVGATSASFRPRPKVTRTTFGAWGSSSTVLPTNLSTTRIGCAPAATLVRTRSSVACRSLCDRLFWRGTHWERIEKAVRQAVAA
jgi:hypothetical protein